MKTKTVSARISGQSYPENLSQGDEGGQSPVQSRYDSNTFQLFQTFRKSQADQDKATRPPSCDSHWLRCYLWGQCSPLALPRQRHLHPDATQTTVLQNKIGRACLVTLYIHLCKSLRTPSSSSSSSFVVSFS